MHAAADVDVAVDLISHQRISGGDGGGGERDECETFEITNWSYRRRGRIV